MLKPAEVEQFPLFSVVVRDPDLAQSDLGLTFVRDGFRIVRVRNVVVTYDPSSSVSTRVLSAIARLRGYRPSAR
jgi:hypothetical protein